MLVDLKDGRCKSCDSALTIVSVEDSSMTVRCIECGEVSHIDSDNPGDGGMSYNPGFTARNPAETAVPTEAHPLMPDDIAARIPPLDATEQEADPVAWVRYCLPGSGCEWFVTEFDPNEQLCFGLVTEDEEPLLAYFTLKELEQIQGPVIRRDADWQPRPLSQCAWRQT